MCDSAASGVRSKPIGHLSFPEHAGLLLTPLSVEATQFEVGGHDPVSGNLRRIWVLFHGLPNGPSARSRRECVRHRTVRGHFSWKVKHVREGGDR